MTIFQIINKNLCIERIKWLGDSQYSVKQSQCHLQQVHYVPALEILVHQDRKGAPLINLLTYNF